MDMMADAVADVASMRLPLRQRILWWNKVAKHAAMSQVKESGTRARQALPKSSHTTSGGGAFGNALGGF